MRNLSFVAVAVVTSAIVMASHAGAAGLVLFDKVDFVTTVAKAFEDKTGLTADMVEPGGTGELLGKISAEGENPHLDIAW